MSNRPVVVVGDVVLDVLTLPQGPLRHGTDTPARVLPRSGGAGANTAAWLAAYGIETTLVTRVGDDALGRSARAELEAAGVRCVWSVDRDRSTGVVVVLVDETGERTMLPDRGANAGLTVADVVDAFEILAHFPGGRPHLHLSGYVLLDVASRATGSAALAAARRLGWSTSVDPQAVGLIERVGAPAFVSWVSGVDLILPNAAEAGVLGGVERLAAVVTTGVAMTDGAAGARWVGSDGTRYAASADPIPARDTTGSGDAFNAGLLAAWLAGRGPQAALEAGVAAGSAAAAGLGARPPRSARSPAGP